MAHYAVLVFKAQDWRKAVIGVESLQGGMEDTAGRAAGVLNGLIIPDNRTMILYMDSAIFDLPCHLKDILDGLIGERQYIGMLQPYEHGKPLVDGCPKLIEAIVRSLAETARRGESGIRQLDPDASGRNGGGGGRNSRHRPGRDGGQGSGSCLS